MRIDNIDDIRREDLADHDSLVAAFKTYLMEEFFYDEFEAELVAGDLDNPYDTPYIMQEYEGTINIDGISYEVRSCRTDFCACGLFHLAYAPPFEFYMLFDESTMSGNTVGDYQKSRKVYVI